MLQTDYKGPGIYAIHNTTKDKYYIGSSKHVSQRIANHSANLKAGRHYNKQLQADYSSGDSFETLIILKMHTDLHEELLTRESIAIDRMKKEHKKLYNVATLYEDRYMSRNTIMEFLADKYCREHLGMTVNRFFARCPAEYNMLYLIHEHPEQEDELRRKYAPIIKYQNLDSYYHIFYGISYEHWMSLDKQTQDKLKADRKEYGYARKAILTGTA